MVCKLIVFVLAVFWIVLIWYLYSVWSIIRDP